MAENMPSGSRPDGSKSDGSRSDGSRSDGSRSDGSRSARFPVYRSGWHPAGARGLGLPSLGLVGIMAGLAQLARNGAPLPILLGLPVLLIALFVALRFAVRRSATLTDGEHITAQSAFHTRRTAWRDVQAIEVESNPAATADAGVAREFVALYDSAGRRVLLPHLDSRSTPALRDEARTLRALWERQRGEDWAPIPGVAAKVVETRRTTDRYIAVMAGLVAGLAAMLVAAVFFLALLFTGNLDDLEGLEALLLSPAVVLVVPGVLCGVVVAVYAARRRRRSELRPNEATGSRCEPPA